MMQWLRGKFTKLTYIMMPRIEPKLIPLYEIIIHDGEPLNTWVAYDVA